LLDAACTGKTREDYQYLWYLGLTKVPDNKKLQTPKAFEKCFNKQAPDLRDEQSGKSDSSLIVSKPTSTCAGKADKALPQQSRLKTWLSKWGLRSTRH
jgi:hypothetical protein